MLRSRAQRGVSKHEEQGPGRPSFETRARRQCVRPPQDEADRRMCRVARIPDYASLHPGYANCSSSHTASLVPAARFCARVLLVSFPSTPMRGERSAERRTISVVARFGARRSALVEARRASSGTRSPLGAPPWRFWAGGRASFSGISSGSVQRAPRSQVVVPGGRDPGPLEPAVASRSRETPLLAPPSGSPLEDAPHERD
jgi:hypothetical protein